MLRDYNTDLSRRIQQASAMKVPPGPANSPVSQPANTSPTLDTIVELLTRILRELLDQNTPLTPILRSSTVSSSGATLDWSAFGTMAAVSIRNKGPDSVFVSFDMSGESVDANVTDNSFELQAQESLNLGKVKFQKIGVKCASGKTGSVNAIGFKSVTGQGSAI